VANFPRSPVSYVLDPSVLLADPCGYHGFDLAQLVLPESSSAPSWKPKRNPSDLATLPARQALRAPR